MSYCLNAILLIADFLAQLFVQHISVTRTQCSAYHIYTHLEHQFALRLVYIVAF